MTKSMDKTFVLAGDIGGTKTNLGLFLKGKKRPVPKAIETFSSQNAPGLEHIIRQFLEIRPVSVTHACFGVAGPVVNGKSKTTNLPWNISEDRIQKQFNFHHVKLVNDLTATAMAIPRDLKEPVGHRPSSLIHSFASPTASAIRGTASIGVIPSPKPMRKRPERTGSSSA